jgi:4-hydroxythreonine-4-phosphate dehydrogenase
MTKQKQKPVIAVTTGDPGGIGPEITAGLFASYRPARSRAVIIGAAGVLEESGLAAPVVEHAGTSLHLRGQVSVVDNGCRARYRAGADSKGGGQHAGASLDVACRLARAGIVQAIVTAPISKRALNRAGYRFAGHTEFLARFFGAPDCQMMMVYRDLRVVPITRHIPLRRVSAILSSGRITTALRVVDDALRRQFGITQPRIVVSGLNPHAGEGGTLGTEEQNVILPAIRRARRGGLDVTGPQPADALFQTVGGGTFDAFLTMYHDQGLIPFKMLAKRRGVNVTVGLPIVRTSVDHGVAYDIAGQGIASTDSLLAAYRLAEKLTAGE